ncbi:hypothetical protein C8R43DRAFT_952586 [Mycena crocata]|nr:hypothetical protein C8R43DRAFT_952586 [Mycena crocata]
MQPRIMTALFSVSFILALAALASSVQAAALPHGLSFHRGNESGTRCICKAISDGEIVCSGAMACARHERSVVTRASVKRDYCNIAIQTIRDCSKSRFETNQKQGIF